MKRLTYEEKAKTDKSLKKGKVVYKVVDELGGRDIHKGVVDHYDKESDMYYVTGEQMEDWYDRTDLFTSFKKAKQS